MSRKRNEGKTVGSAEAKGMKRLGIPSKVTAVYLGMAFQHNSLTAPFTFDDIEGIEIELESHRLITLTLASAKQLKEQLEQLLSR